MGSVGKQNSIARSTMEEPVLGFTTYKSTPEMKDFVMQIAKEIQSDFPLLDRSFTINFNKYQTSAGEVRAHSDTVVDLSGSLFKKYVEKSKLPGGSTYANDLKGFVAHELTHIMQNRFGFRKGSPAQAEFISKMWNSAVSRYRLNHPDVSDREIDRLVRGQYGGGGHTRMGNDPAEKMAVAVERAYKFPLGKGTTEEIGRILISDLKKMKEKR